MYKEKRTTHNWLIYHICNATVSARLPELYGRVLDVGCGERPFASEILQYADSYIGMDWSNSLHQLRADIIADASRGFPFQDATFDHVISLEVIEHLAEPDHMLCETFRVLQAGGELTLSVPFQWWVHEAPWDFQRFTCHGLRYRLEKAGFEVLVIEAQSGFWSMWFLKLNYQLRRLVRGHKWTRHCIHTLLIPIWWLNQQAGRALDHVWREERETTGYFVVARKP